MLYLAACFIVGIKAKVTQLTKPKSKDYGISTVSLDAITFQGNIIGAITPVSNTTGNSYFENTIKSEVINL